MGLFVMAWLTGQGIIVYRTAKEQHMPASPRQLAVASGLFVLLAVIAEYRPARPVVAAFAVAVDLAVLMRVLPGGGQPTSIKANAGAPGWAGIAMAGNTVIIPDGTIASTGVDNSGGSGTGLASSTGGEAGAAAAGGSAGQNQAIAQNIIKANPQFNGWAAGLQWSSLVNLWNRESGWSTGATNPSSGAYGVPQSLHGNRGGQGGNEFNASDAEGLTSTQLAQANAGNATAQILWGLNYILATYGSPAAAWQHEQSAGWY